MTPERRADLEDKGYRVYDHIRDALGMTEEEKVEFDAHCEAEERARAAEPTFITHAPSTKAFDGFDWLELAERWGFCREDDDATLRETCRAYMRSCFGNPERAAKVAADIREFLAVLIVEDRKWGTYCTPVWEGLLKIERHANDEDNAGADEALIGLTIPLLEYMWN